MQIVSLRFHSEKGHILMDCFFNPKQNKYCLPLRSLCVSVSLPLPPSVFSTSMQSQPYPVSGGFEQTSGENICPGLGASEKSVACRVSGSGLVPCSVTPDPVPNPRRVEPK